MQQRSKCAVIRAVAVPLFACLVSLVSVAAASSGSTSGIPWSASAPITWDHFLASPPADAVHRSEAAAIHMTIRWHASYSVTSNGGAWSGAVQSVTVTNTMEPALSWVVSARADDRVLCHERAHFDLNEVYRRKLEILLPCLSAQSPTKDGVMDALDAALHRRASAVLEQLQALQARFDTETNHGSNAAAQARWEAQIASWLENPTAAP